MSERFAWIFDKEKKKKVWVADMWSRRAILAIQTAISDAVARITTMEGAGYQTGPDVSAAIAKAIGGITELEYIVVSSLPSSGKKGVVYLVPHQHGTQDVYDEYIWVSNSFEKIGNTDVDLSQYLLKTDIAEWAKQSSKPEYTASEVGALPDSTEIPSKTSDLTNDSGYITDYTETDPTVPAWAKESEKPKYTASEVGALPDNTFIPTKTSDLTNDSGYITGYTETDPTVPSWAKQSSKPKYTASEVGALPDNTEIPSKTSDLTNDSGFITSSDVPPASTANPSMDGAASPGSSRNYARADHVHPSDTSKQDALSTEQLSVINNCLTINTVTGTTDANGNLKVFNGTLKHIVASWGSNLVMVPFIFNTNTYLKVMRSNSTHTAVVNERVTAYYIAV